MPNPLEVSALYGQVELNISVPSTYDEADSLVGEIGGCLRGFIADCTARNFLPRLYKAVAKKLTDSKKGEKLVLKETPPEKDGGTVTKVYETDIVFIDRVRKAADAEEQASIDELLRSTATEIPYYEKGAERTGFGKVSQGALDAANGLFANGDEAVENAVEKIEAFVPSYKIGRDTEQKATPESLARGIMAMQKHIQQKAQADAMAQLAV